LENANQLAAWARDSGLQYLSLLGGEPFLHPEMAVIVSGFRQVSPGTNLQILTGGIFKKELLDTLSPSEVGLIFNVNEPRDYKNPQHFAIVTANIETAIRKGFRVILGYNVWRMDFDTAFMPNLAHHLGRSSFRWTVANPQWSSPPNVVQPAQYGVLAEGCFAMLQEAAKLDIEALLDCPLPLCFFKDSELAWIRQYHPGTAARLGACQPVLDITPELEVIRCFALSKIIRVKVTEFPNEMAIQHWFQKNVDSRLLNRGCFPYCHECPHFRSGRCTGGCLAWHDCDVNMEQDTSDENLALNMLYNVEDGKPGIALEQYERANLCSKTEVPTFIAAAAASQLGKLDQAFRYASLAQDMAIDPGLKKNILDLMANIQLAQNGLDAVEFREKIIPPFIAYSRELKNEANLR
jgi:hypothetical protein